MSFINKEDPVVLNIMITSKGREKLSTGKLNFKYFTIGDSEIDYNLYNNYNFESYKFNILRPLDKNPSIISNILKNSNSSEYNEITGLNSITYDVINKQESLGFFNINGDKISYIEESTHIKQPDCIVYMSGVTGGNKIKIRQNTKYGRILSEPMINDFLLVKWSTSLNTITSDINLSNINQNIIYKIKDITGSLSSNNLELTVDRDIPNYIGYYLNNKSGAYILYNKINEDLDYSTDYINESVNVFLNNYQCDIHKFPIWNLSIVFIEDVIGIQNNNRLFNLHESSKYAGFISYIQNQNKYYKKLGIIHYSNNSPNNTYAEEFSLDSSEVIIPTIMWHKSKENKIGLKLKANGESKLLESKGKSLDIEYYDLIDTSSKYVVGKVFNGLKLFIIEDQELLFALSYKSNRSWTLPNFLLGTLGSNPCNDTIIPPSRPIMNDITEENCSTLYISWSKSISKYNPITYYLYRSDDEIGNWILIDDQLTELSYIDSNLINGRTYGYKVCAVDNIHNISEYSNIVSHLINCIKPSSPVLSPITLNNLVCNVFKLNWTASISNNNPIKYILYRSDDEIPNWIVINDNITNLFYIDNNFGRRLINGRTYKYKVIAIDVNNNIPSDASNIQNRLVKCNNETTITTTTINTMESIQFSDNIDNDVAKFTINLSNNSMKYSILFNYYLEAKIKNNNNDTINNSSATNLWISYNDGIDWSLIDSVTAIKDIGDGYTTKSINDSYIITDISNPNNIKIKIDNDYLDNYKYGNGSVTIKYYNDEILNDKLNVNCPDKYIKINNEASYITCSTIIEDENDINVPMFSLLDNNIIQDSDNIIFEFDDEIIDGILKFKTNYNRFNKIKLSWSTTSHYLGDDSIDSSITTLKISYDGGNTWSSINGSIAYIDDRINTNSGVYYLNNIDDITKCRIKIDTDYINNIKYGTGIIVIESVETNNNILSLNNNTKYIKNENNEDIIMSINIANYVNFNTINNIVEDNFNIKDSKIIYSESMNENDSYVLHLKNELYLDESLLGNGSFSCISIDKDSVNMFNKCVISGDSYQSYDISFTVNYGETVEVYNKTFGIDNNSNQIISSTTINKIDEISNSGHFIIGDTCNNVTSRL